MAKKKSSKRGEKLTSKDSDKKLGLSQKDLDGLSRRERAKLRAQVEADSEINGAIVNNSKPRSLETSRHGRGDSSKLLTSSDPRTVEQDIKLTQQAVDRGWNVPRKKMLVKRLLGIVEKTTGDMSTKDGIVESETVADKLAIDASKVLVAMNAQDVSRLEKNKPVAPSTVVNVNNNVINSNNSSGFDARTIELARLAYKFGAREFSVNGKQIPILEIVGAIEPVSTQEGSTGNQKQAPDQTSS